MRKQRLKSATHSLKKRWQVEPLNTTLIGLQDWFYTASGQALLHAQDKMLEDELGYLFGYHLMQLSVHAEHKFYESSRINHRFSISPLANESPDNAQACSDFEALPLPDECIDVCILHHVLDFAANPQQVLKEAARVTVPRGYIVLMGFNPNSLAGLFKPFAHFGELGPIWKRNSLRTRRLSDWLAFLDFSVTDVQYGGYGIPLNNTKFINNTRFYERVMTKLNSPLGSAYCIFARKDRVGFTPLKPEWDKPKGLMDAVPLPKRAISRDINRPTAQVIPMRRRSVRSS